MSFDIKTILGYQFVKVAHFYSCGKPYEIKKGKRKGEKWSVDTAISFYDGRFIIADESAYVIFAGDEAIPRYVGEYIFNLRSRWVKELNGYLYADHHMIKKIDLALKEKSTLPVEDRVTLWVAIDPYAITPDGSKINISKSLENEIMRRDDLSWNTRGQVKSYEKKRAKECIKLSSIIPS